MENKNFFDPLSLYSNNVEYKEIPTGSYKVELTKIEGKETQKGGHYYNLTLKIVEGDLQKSNIFIMVNDKINKTGLEGEEFDKKVKAENIGLQVICGLPLVLASENTTDNKLVSLAKKIASKTSYHSKDEIIIDVMEENKDLLIGKTFTAYVTARNNEFNGEVRQQHSLSFGSKTINSAITKINSLVTFTTENISNILDDSIPNFNK